MKRLKFFFVSLLGLSLVPPFSASAQFPKKQIPVFVIAKPHKAVYKPGEPILVDVEIKNELKEEIRLNYFSFSPNEWNGETAFVQLPDIYRLPEIGQIGLKRPVINVPRFISGTGWHPVPAGASKIRTIDISKWEIKGGWVTGKYQIQVRLDKIDVDEHTWMSVTSDPFTFEIQ